MDVTCPECKKTFSIPDEKITFDKTVSGKCPVCKRGVITIEPSKDFATKVTQAKAEHAKAVPDTAWPQTSPPGVPTENSVSEELPSPKQSARSLPDSAALKKRILYSIGDLPAIPDVVVKARRIMQSPLGGIRVLATTLEKDTGLAGRILRLANSAYYGLSGKVTSIQVACVLMGENILSEIINTAGVAALMDKSLQGYGLRAGDFWQHTLAVSVCARLITKKHNPALESDAFMTGILHDAGKLVMEPYVHTYREHFDTFLEAPDRTWLQAEKQILGFDHAEIASQVCRKWNFPDTFALPVRYHHYPSRSSGNFMAYVLHLSDYVATISGLGLGSDDLLYHLEDGTLSFLNIRQKEITDLLSQVVEAVEHLVADSR